jgi:hypothetical protein
MSPSPHDKHALAAVAQQARNMHLATMRTHYQSLFCQVVIISYALNDFVYDRAAYVEDLQDDMAPSALLVLLDSWLTPEVGSLLDSWIDFYPDFKFHLGVWRKPDAAAVGDAAVIK